MVKDTLLRRLNFFVVAGLIGAIVGFSTLLLIKLILLVQFVSFGDASEMRYAEIAAARPAWQLILVLTLGGLLVGVILQFLPDRRYHGIADVMEACALNSARMPARSGIAAALAAAVSLGVGAPLGREGPAVHIGASISAWLAEKLGLDRKQSLALLGCGAAAAVAVSFNTPIAAVIFALEVIVGYYTLRVFAPVVIAAMAAMIVRDLSLGNAPLFQVPEHTLSSHWELIIFALIGVLGAFVAKALISMTQGIGKIWEWSGAPGWFRPTVAGALIGCFAIPLPLILSIGAEGTLLALQASLPVIMLISLLVVKTIVVALALGSGFAGGVFGPAIFIGSVLGGLLWALLSASGLPLSDQGVYATIGMAALASALLGAPISTVLIVFELTHDYNITLGVMAAAAFASTFMQLGEHSSFFRWQLARRNVNLSRGRDISLLMTRRVEDLISDAFLQAEPGITAGQLESKLGLERRRLVMFVDEEGVFHGSVTLANLISHAIEHGMDSTAMDAAFDTDYAISPDANIVTAVQIMAERQVEYVPVVSRGRASTPELLGIVVKSELLAEHYDVVKRAREDEFGIT